MKLSRDKLKQIIKEELEEILGQEAKVKVSVSRKSKDPDLEKALNSGLQGVVEFNGKKYAYASYGKQYGGPRIELYDMSIVDYMAVRGGMIGKEKQEEFKSEGKIVKFGGIDPTTKQPRPPIPNELEHIKKL